MFEYFEQLPTWVQNFWFAYVTFHDLLQWGIMGIIGLTAYGQRKHKKELLSRVDELRKELEHVHDEIHIHLGEPYGKENEHRRIYRVAKSLHDETGPS